MENVCNVVRHKKIYFVWRCANSYFIVCLAFRSSRLCKMLLLRSNRVRQGSAISSVARDVHSFSLPSSRIALSLPPSGCSTAIAGAAPRARDLGVSFDTADWVCLIHPDGKLHAILLLSSGVGTELPQPPAESVPRGQVAP